MHCVTTWCNTSTFDISVFFFMKEHMDIKYFVIIIFPYSEVSTLCNLYDLVRFVI